LKKTVYLSLAAATVICANEITIQKSGVFGVEDSKSSSVYSSQLSQAKQLDLAEALANTNPELTMVRKGYGTGDLILRGFAKDDVRVVIDEQNIHCACPNRMDPPLYHLSPTEVEKIEVITGPFNVENAGGLGGSVLVTTKKPSKGISGEINGFVGSYGYRGGSITANAGSDKAKVSFTYNRQDADQYEDGQGNKIYKINLKAASSTTPGGYDPALSPSGLKAFERNSYELKALFNPTVNDEIELRFFADRPGTILYPALGMDAFQDDTDMYSLKYKGKNKVSFSDVFAVELYGNKVTHDMRTDYRQSGGITGTGNKSYYVTAETKGAKISNESNIAGHNFTVGADFYERVWDSKAYSRYSTKTLETTVPYPLADTTTKDIALFAKLNKNSGALSTEIGLRYDSAKIDIDESKANLAVATTANKAAILANSSDSFSEPSGYVLAKYNLSTTTSLFGGLGRSVRLPDGAEKFHLAIHGREGNPYLKPAKNNEIDVGIEQKFKDVSLKLSGFYSSVNDYIYMYAYKQAGGMNWFTYDNVDVKIYGATVSAIYSPLDGLTIDSSLAYQKGTKDTGMLYGATAANGTTVITTTTDKNLRGIPPVKAKVSVSYESMKYYAGVEWIAAAGQKDIDTDGFMDELETSGWSVVNLKGGYKFSKSFRLNAGIDNIFDKTYTTHGSQAGELFLTNGTTVRRLNEPGRLMYANLNYKF